MSLTSPGLWIKHLQKTVAVLYTVLSDLVLRVLRDPCRTGCSCTDQPFGSIPEKKFMKIRMTAQLIIIKNTGRADSRLLGALRKPVSREVGWGGWRGRVVMNEIHLSVFHSASNRARRKHCRNSLFRCSLFFQLVDFVSSIRLYNIHVT